jgi:hypothetical protein
MRAILEYLPTVAFCVGGWVFINGVLHDIFVLLSDHGKKYDRELLRLLMDGHILITCGAVQIIAFKGLQANEQWAFYAAGVACISLLVYCGMIYPFLKSIVTMTLNTLLLLMIVVRFIFP